MPVVRHTKLPRKRTFDDGRLMETPVHRYRGYEILCSQAGYTVIKGGVEVLSVGSRNARPGLSDCASTDHLLSHAKAAIDALEDPVAVTTPSGRAS